MANRVYRKTDEVYRLMLDACENSRSEILFEQYIFEDYYPEGIGAEFLKVFIKKARSGVRVVLNFDALGSLRVFMDGGLQAKLLEAGVELHFYRGLPRKMLRPVTRFVLRNHTKVLIIDGKEVWIGGVVVGDKYREWDDLTVQYKDQRFGKKFRNYFFNQIRKHKGKQEFQSIHSSINEDTEMMTNSPGFINRSISNSILKKIKGAKESIKIVTPYFSPPHRIWSQLKKAAHRGVEVTLLIPKIADYSLVNYVHLSYLKPLIKIGISVYMTKNMSHGKLVVVDDEWATFGSANFDSLSLSYNHELNVATTNRGLLRSLIKYVDDLRDDIKPLDKKFLSYGIGKSLKVYFFSLFRFIT